jgi:uncharacterized Zn finger protein
VKPVSELAQPDVLNVLATPSEYRLGQEIAANKFVEIEASSPERVVAHATGGQRRLVELHATPEGLAYTCTCNSKLERPCKHVVAVGLVNWQQTQHQAG